MEMRTHTIWDKKEDAGRGTSVHGALEELGLVEQQVEVTRSVELGVLEAVDVVHVLVEDA